jgi:hypothetical protein
MQAERSLLAKTLCLAALLGAAYVLATGTPNTATGAFSMAPSVRPAQATPEAVSRAVGVWMEGGALDKDPNLAANLAKAEEQRLAFKQRNPDNGELPSYLPFGEKMGGGYQGPSGEIQEERYKYTYYQDKFGSK